MRHLMRDTVDVRQPVGIEIMFRVLREGPPLFAKIKVHDRQGNIAFNAMDIEPHNHQRSVRLRTIV